MQDLFITVNMGDFPLHKYLTELFVHLSGIQYGWTLMIGTVKAKPFVKKYHISIHNVSMSPASFFFCPADVSFQKASNQSIPIYSFLCLHTKDSMIFKATSVKKNYK